MNPSSILAGILPVLLFVVLLRVMDSFKLVHRSALAQALGGGLLVAGLSWAIQTLLVNEQHVSVGALRFTFGPVMSVDSLRFTYGPVMEELLKAALVAWWIHRDRVGFVVDAAILGFAIGAGFAVIENLYYASVLQDSSLALWLVRGLGTAVMHGMTTGLFAVLGKALSDRYPRAGIVVLLPGILVSILFHILFNRFGTAPFLTTAVVVIATPLVFMAAFEYSERMTRAWLSTGFDGEMEMLDRILEGDVESTPVGRYLDSIREHFDPLVVADMFCLLTLHLELALRAKGMLLAREVGAQIPIDDDLRARLKEMRHLEQTIGQVGCMALLPLRRANRRDLWQLMLLERE